MKIQCSCGTKYSFDITPDMAQSPIQFVCQNCGLDSSDTVNELIRREFAPDAAVSEPSQSPPPPPTPVQAPAPAPAAAAHSSGTARLRIHAAKPAEPAPGDPPLLPICMRHPGHATTHLCLLCQKPICPKCMELFGYLCGPRCIAKAEAEGIEIPRYAGIRSVVEGQQWRKIGAIAGAIATVVAALLGFWFWYAWFGSVPKTVFSVRFDKRAYSGQSVLCTNDQLVFLHGDRLARYEMKEKKELWSRQLIDRERLAREVNRALKELHEAQSRVEAENPFAPFKIPTLEEMTEMMEREEAAALRLHVHGQNVWVSTPDKLVRYDWNSGKPTQDIPLPENYDESIVRSNELLLVQLGEAGQQILNHINLATGESRIEKIGEPLPAQVAGNSAKRGSPNSAAQTMAGLPVGKPGANAGQPMDPAKVAEQAQNLTVPAKIALPAIVASAYNQERALRELNEEPGARRRSGAASALPPAAPFSLIPSSSGYIQFSVQLIESRIRTRNAMKSPPAKSALDGELTAARTDEVANEILNEIQRDRGGAIVTEDESRYQVTVRLPDRKEAPQWTGEVIGPPSLFPLKTVNVVAAGKMVVVLDKMNKKLWQAPLTYRVRAAANAFEEETPLFGEGPCVERGDMLYVCDEAVLTAFNLATGEARWRIPSVGIVGLLFDEEGLLYVNTTTASPESIKYSRQIDVSQKVSAEVLKIDPRTGRTIWSTHPQGLVAQISGKFVYTLSSHQADEDESHSPFLTGLEIPSHVRIKRLNPANGHELWEHYEQRMPVDVQFAGATIQLVFKKEVEVLRFFSF